MKHLNSSFTYTFCLISVFVFGLIFLTTCNKEPLPENTRLTIADYNYPYFDIDVSVMSRAGGDTVLFLPTYSENNSLSGDSVETHRIFNQAKIKYVKFLEDKTIPNFGIGFGVIAKNYQATEVFINDSTATRQIHVAGATAKEFTHFPNLANNLLTNTHPAIVVELKKARGEKTINFYRDNPIIISNIKVYYDGKFKFEKIFMPWSKAANSFNPGHRII